MVYKEYTHAVLIKFTDSKGTKDFGQGVLGISNSSSTTTTATTPFLKKEKEASLASQASLASHRSGSMNSSNSWSRGAEVQLSSGGVSLGSINLEFTVVEGRTV